MDRGDLFSVRTDISNMEKRMNRYVTELGMGEKEVLLTQGRLLAKDISDASPPKSLSKAKQRANKQVARAFYKKPENLFPDGSTEQGKGEINWLYAGGRGAANFVVGIDRQNLHSGETLKDVLEVLKSKQKGANWERRTNDRGAHVMIVKKPMISRTMFGKAVKYVQDRFGRLKASWVKAARQAGCEFEVKAFVARHISGARGKGVANLEPNNPHKYLLFISDADGVQSEASWKAIRGGIHGRAQKMAVDLRNIERGAYKRAGFALAQ